MIKHFSRFLLRKPEAGLALSFFLIILIGTLLLSLPWATKNDISLLDALFTSTSATCVTGLIVKDTGQDFTLFGQIVIMILIQLGILEIMGFASLFFLALRERISITEETFLKESMEVEFRREAKKLLKFIFISILVIEAFGTIFLFWAWNENFPNTGQAFFSSLFHSVSAFCNAGFSLFSDSLEVFRGSTSINFIFGILIFLGSLGFLTIRELKQKFISLFKSRLSPYGQRFRISFYSKIILIFVLGLVILGAALFYFFEKGNLSELDTKTLWLTAFFQSVTRTAGFNTIDIGELSHPTLLVLMFLMFVGGAPGSAAGGIKVISLALIIIFIIVFFKRKEEATIFRHTISPIFFRKVLVLVSVCLIITLAGTLILLYTEKGQLEEILFEAISAFGTVGLSMGLTPSLSTAGKVVIIILMYLGRTTPLTLALIGARELIKAKVHFLDEKIYLG